MGCSIPRGKKTPSEVSLKKSTSRQLSITPGTFVKMSRTFNYSDYIEMDKLGSGAFADVMLCLHKPTKTYRAVKIIHKSGLSVNQKDSLFMLKEIQILKNLDHPNILKCFEIFEDERRYFVATEYCPAGDLFGEILKMKKFTEAQASEIMRQLLSALIYCHDKRVIHRDLKPENILLMEKGESVSVKVADFGSSCILDPECRISGCFGSAYYLAPEVFKNSYDQKCDVWSLGIIMYILLTGKPPYPGKDSESILRNVKENPFVITPFKTVGISEQAVDLLKKLLTIRADTRISAREAILHPWIATYTEKDLSGLEAALTNLKEFNCQSKLKEAVHVFLAAQVTSYEDIKAYKNSFQMLDKDGDGKITRAELIEEYRKTMKLQDAEELASEIIEKLDQDGDGNIDYTEFLISCTEKQKHISLENLEIAFKMFDIDGSGTITVDEIKSVLGDGQMTEEATWKEILEEADANGDGCIDLREFIQMMSSFQTIDSQRAGIQ